MHRSGGRLSQWRVGDTAVKLHHLFGQWCVRGNDPQTAHWIADNGLREQWFETRADALRATAACMAVDPLPAVTPVRLIRSEDGWRSSDGHWAVHLTGTGVMLAVAASDEAYRLLDLGHLNHVSGLEGMTLLEMGRVLRQLGTRIGLYFDAYGTRAS